MVYPDGFRTTVTVTGLQDVLCGATRPGHFDGVATVVTKLLLMTAPDQAFFGEKDWQQLQIIRRLVSDLNIPVRVQGCATVREPGGLAMSSRNMQLSPEDRERASVLNRAMARVADALRLGIRKDEALGAARQAILAAGFTRIDYLDLRQAETLDDLEAPQPPCRLFAAAWIGGVRLIDNIAVL